MDIQFMPLLFQTHRIINPGADFISNIGLYSIKILRQATA